VELGVHRLADADDRRISWFSSRQIDARQIVVALTQLLNAEQLEQGALRDLGIDQAVRDALAQARERFEAALPGIKHMRDALIHFDEWSRGEGAAPRRPGSGREPRHAGRHASSGASVTTRPPVLSPTALTASTSTPQTAPPPNWHMRSIWRRPGPLSGAIGRLRLPRREGQGVGRRRTGQPPGLPPPGSSQEYEFRCPTPGCPESPVFMLTFSQTPTCRIHGLDLQLVS